MKCAQALELLLDADPADLAGQGASPLATHVRDCVRCQRVSSQLLNDTHLLAAASMGATRAQRVQRRTLTLVFVAPATVAVAILVMTMLRGSNPETRDSVVSMVEVTVAAPSTPEVPSPASRITHHESRTQHASPVASPATVRLGKAFPRPVPLVPVKVEQKDRVVTNLPNADAQTVAVAPPAGMRAAVLQTSDPKLVVVWLY